MKRNRVSRAALLAAVAGLATGFASAALAQSSPLLSPTPLASTPAPAAPAATGAPPPAAAAPAITLPAVPAAPPVAASLPKVPAATQPDAAAAAGTVVSTPPAATAAAPAAPAMPAAPAEASAPTAAPAPSTPVVVAKKKRVAPPAPPRETALSTDPEPTLTAETFFATAKASERYAAIADAGGWPEIAGPVSPGASGKAVSTLRLRLAIEGDLGKAEGGDPADLSAGMFSQKWGTDLTAAVKRFQARHGLKDTGVVAGATLKAMNVPARTRFTELASSAQRLAGRNISFADRYVVVNIPSASVEAVENGKVVHRYVAVVGGPEHASPEVDAKVQAVNLNPTWTVPTSIIKNEIIPHMQKDPGYLSRQRIKILDGAGNVINARSIDWTSQKATNYILRQDSGTSNALGNIRINMPNKYAVYMHDTPSKRFFGGDYRFLSHGCVRVEGVFDLAAWLLEGTGGSPAGTWTRDAMLGQVKTGEHEDIKLSKPVPVAWVYLTGWADPSGTVQFRDDVYGIDTVGANVQAANDPIATAINKN
ncbi:L,D-transpeptidase family protein [Lichenibacterium dinghuense]|uniref:L,D-transpeptidase family protein n=1 Tax=Lichenibacterium dinghuense TaxID=2895977 RepID=UPI001F004627|nr:L,D-transpeptidase family protein [Lichenibacterium sp. 6Y81]